MMPAAASQPVTAWEIPTHGRPSFVDVFKGDDVPAAAAGAAHVPHHLLPASRSRDGLLRARRHAYAYISPDNAPARASPDAFVRAVFRTLAPDLPQDFELSPSYYGDVTLCFRTPDDREAAMRRQPFEVAGGVTVTLVREGRTPNVTGIPMNCLAHVALRRYPVEQRTEEEIRANCFYLGHALEVHPSCFAAPDLATVFVVLQIEHPRQIPRELRIRYSDGFSSIVPVEILRVWDRSESMDGNGDYMPLFQQSPAAAPPTAAA